MWLKSIMQLPADEVARAFSSLDVNYQPPYVDRLYVPWSNGGRLMLHRTHQCKPRQAMMHNHEWPSVMEIVEGAYDMVVHQAKSWVDVALGKEALDGWAALVTHLPTGSSYSMPNRNTFHAICPTTPTTLSIMLTGPKWGTVEEAKASGLSCNWTSYPPDLTPVKGMLKPLSDQTKLDLINKFKHVLL
jgi:hypothetical protein